MDGTLIHHGTLSVGVDLKPQPVQKVTDVIIKSSVVIIRLGKWIEWEMFMFYHNHLAVRGPMVTLCSIVAVVWVPVGCGLYIPVTSVSGGGPYGGFKHSLVAELGLLVVGLGGLGGGEG